MIKSFTYLFSIAVLLSVLTLSCSRKAKSYTLVGTLMDSCGGTPIAEAILHLYGDKVAVLKKTRLDFGGTQTDANGYFAISNVTLNELTLKAAFNRGRYILLDDYNVGKLSRSGDSINLGYIYMDHISIAEISVQASGNYTLTDTLFIGTSPDSFTAISPIKDTLVQLRSASQGISPPSNAAQSVTMFWGIGRAQFEEYTKGNLPENLQQHQLNLQMGICAVPMPSTLYVP